MQNVVAIVLGGGRGTRLHPLTSIRSKPAVPLAGKYRLIDIPLSNCINSGINKIYVLTQFMSASLHRHIRRTYSFDLFSNGFVEILAAQQTDDAGEDWFEGTADAVRKTLRYIEQEGIDYVLILSGDQLYRMDYEAMVKTHCDSGADVTIGGMPVHRKDAGALGIMRLDEQGNVVGFLEKPQTEEDLNLVAMSPQWLDGRGIDAQGRDCVASMGIYVFNRQSLHDVLTKTTYTDFGKEVFPAAIRSRHVKMHLFDGYWEDIGTIRSFYEANLSLAHDQPPFEFAAAGAPIYTRARYLPPTKISNASIKQCLIADGCHIGEGATIENSVIGLRCIIGPGAVVRNSVIMGADYFDVDRASFDQSKGHTPLGIGANSLLDGVIVDKNCRIGKNVRVINEHNLPDDKDLKLKDVLIRDGIPIVVKGATLPDNWTL
jgi:glucose-1-phosphate adenylyltransferase